jgi:signal transduction histidine kinase/sensor domain CHASE-containing protein
MNIRKRVIIISCLIFLSSLAFCFPFSYLTLFNGFKVVEKNQIVSDLANTENAFANYMSNQSVKLSDWASWDDAYKYVVDKNSAFVESNLQPQSLAQIGLDMMVFINQEGQIIKAVRTDPDKLAEVPLPNSFVDYLKEHKDKILAKNIDSKNEGIIMLPEGVLVFSAKPLLTSSGQGPIHGTLIFGRFFDKRIVDYLSNLTHLKTTVNSYNQKNIPADFESAKIKLASNKYYINPLDNSRIEGYFLLKDQLGLPSLIIKVETQRDVYMQGTRTIMVMWALIVTVLLVSIISFYILLNRLIISKITKLSSEVSEITGKEDSMSRVYLSGDNNDEIFILAKNINGMIDDLSEARTREEDERNQLRARVGEFEKKNKELEDSQKAIVNVLDDTKQLEEELEKEKKNVEIKVLERTSQLAQEQARLQASISSLPLGFIMTDAKGNVLIMNGIARSILCIQSVDNSTGVMTKENLKHSRCDLNEVQRRLKGSFDLKFSINKAMKDKKPFEVKELAIEDIFLHIFIVPIVTVDKEKLSVAGSVVLVENITERKIIERSRDEFFSIASHELRTPLTAIRGNTALIRQYYWDKLKDNDLREMVLDIHESSTRLIGIVNDFLDTSRLELGKMEFKKEEVDMELLAKDVLKEYITTGSMKKLYLKIQKPDVKIPLVIADKDRIKQIMINLIGNAIKFTEKGGVTIALKPEKDFVKVLISDTGKGISVESQNLLFRKFQQAAESIFTRDAIHGTGLGLYISKMMADAMGGSMKLESSVVDKGSVFSISLPTTGKVVTEKEALEAVSKKP